MSCEEKSIKTSIKTVLGCLPWSLASDTEKYCSQTDQFSPSTVAEFMKILHMFDNYIPSPNCNTPCTTTLYDSNQIKSEASTNRVIQLIFPEEISVSESQLQYSFLPILTTIGGHIGVCRTFLWVLLGLGGVMTFICKRAPEQH